MNKKSKKTVGIEMGIIHLCTCVMLTFLPIYIFEDFIKSCSFWIQPFLVLLFGIGGIGIYFIVGDKINEISKRLGDKK